MTDFVIRPPEEKDIQALAELNFYMWNDFYSNCVPQAFSEKYYKKEQCRQYQIEMLELIEKSPDKNFALVAIDKKTDKLAALVYISQYEDTPDNDLYIPGFDLELQHMYIWPEYRHKNLGGKLFYKVKAWANDNFHRSFFWWVIDDNPYSGIHLKHGAKVIKQMERDYTGTTLKLTAYGIEL